MKWNRIDLAMVFVGLIPGLGALLMYQDLPEQMATHIGFGNKADQIIARPWAVLMLVLLGAGIPLLTKAIRGIDPRKDSFTKFERAFGIFRWAVTIFMTFTGLILLMYNLGYNVSPKWASSLGVGILFMLLGNYMGQIQFNYTFGIKTPWTLANETVWRQTHRLAGPIWMLAGVIMAFTILLPEEWSKALIIGVLAVAIGWPVLYSYLLYKKIQS